jgi:hypothetical protein
VDTRLLVKPSPVTLEWDVSPDAVAVEIAGVGSVSNTGTTVVAPRCDTTYVLRATSHFGRAIEATIDITVAKEPPRVEHFGVRPLFAREGAQIEVSWKVAGAAALQLAPLGAVGSEGKQILTAPADGRLELFAESYFGVTVSRRIVVGIIRTTKLNRTLTNLLPSPTQLPRRGTRLSGVRTPLGEGCR